ncbi:DUF1697 domain-containing protein [Nocardioides sp. KR10-350]|uniref:DUF1697 domain-containing protein n=1 Tax=Nocardioides cheoyonin TaxID=3156615 RepID=UPI0032B37785
MATWIAFLRAINLGATRKFPKDAIVAAVERAGGRAIETHINTGNVRFDHDVEVRAEVEVMLEEEFLRDRGFEVPTICVTPAELSSIAEEAEAFGHDGRHYVSVLKREPTDEEVARLEAVSSAGEVAKVGGRAVHLLLGSNYHTARLTNTIVEKHLGVATNRNLNVITTLARKWGG